MERERIGSFEQMKVWQEAHALVLKVLKMTPRIPAEQQEGIAMQMEKAAIDVPRGIAEGFKRRGSRNKAHHYNLAQGSLEALRYFFILCRDLKYEIDYDEMTFNAEQVGRMLDGLIRSVVRGPIDRGRGGRDDRGDRGRQGRAPEPMHADGESDSDGDFDDDGNDSST